MWLILAVLALELALVVLYIRRVLNLGPSKSKLPPGPTGWPVLGSLVPIFMNSTKLPHEVMSELSRQYGPIVCFRLGSRLGMTVDSPEMARLFLKDKDHIFASRPFYSAKSHLLYDDNNLGYSPYNKHAKRLRGIMITEILSPKRVQQARGLRWEENEAMVKSILWDIRRADRELGSKACVNVREKLSLLVLNSMTRTMFSKRFFTYGGSSDSDAFVSDTEQALQFKALVEEILHLVVLPFIGDYVPYLGFLDKLKNLAGVMEAARSRMDSFLDKVIDEHRRYLQSCESTGPDHARDFLDVLLALPGEDGADHLTDSEIKGILMDMYNAGTDTSSLAVEWALAELLRHPEQMEKAQQELDAVVGRDRLVTEDDTDSLPYLQAVVKETFRLHPVVPALIPHCSTEPCEVAGYHIPANTALFVNTWAMARNPKVWDHPTDFDPERFVNSEVGFRGSHYQLLPFGTGRRRCPGINLGALVIHHTLARLLQAFDWSLPDGVKPNDLDMSESLGLTLPRKTPLVAVPYPRLSTHLY